MASSISFSQSKKEQIKILTNRVDSLNSVLGVERKINNDKTNQINSLDYKIVGLESDIANLNKKISDLEADKKEMFAQVSANKTNLAAKDKELNVLKAELISKTDSLDLMRTELTKFKPAPKPVLTNYTVNQITQTGSFKSVKIGTQTWMIENLNVERFRNGDLIPQAKTNDEWERAGENKKPAWCYYDNDPKNGAKYGKLYNWYAVNDPRGLAPAGWHVPTDTEWTTLGDYLGNDAGMKMKSTSGWDSWEEDLTCKNCESWNVEYRKKTACHVCKDTRVNGKKTHSGNGSNSSSFSGLPGGYHDSNDNFYDEGFNGYWFSISEYSTNQAYYCWLRQDNTNILRWHMFKGLGLSVRCVKD
jgi:uncharacterized protein (TIGR02145 family)